MKKPKLKKPKTEAEAPNFLMNEQMTIEARRIAHKAESNDRRLGNSACGALDPEDATHEALIRETRAHSAGCNELAFEIFEALLRVKYMRAVK